MIDLERKYKDEILSIINWRLPGCRIFVFGSRLGTNHHKYADIDIALDNNSPIDWKEILRIKDEFAISDIPIIVDVCDLNSVSPEFKQIILSNYEILE